MHDMIGSENRVAVYGTLKKHQPNHRLLADQRYLGRCKLREITLYDLGPYPGARLKKSGGVVVEVYEVSDAVFDRLDELEGFCADSPAAGLYDRTRLDTPYGWAWVYLYNHTVCGCREIRFGGWP